MLGARRSGFATPSTVGPQFPGKGSGCSSALPKSLTPPTVIAPGALAGGTEGCPGRLPAAATTTIPSSTARATRPSRRLRLLDTARSPPRKDSRRGSRIVGDAPEPNEARGRPGRRRSAPGRAIETNTNFALVAIPGSGHPRSSRFRTRSRRSSCRATRRRSAPAGARRPAESARARRHRWRSARADATDRGERRSRSRRTRPRRRARDSWDRGGAAPGARGSPPRGRAAGAPPGGAPPRRAPPPAAEPKKRSGRRRPPRDATDRGSRRGAARPAARARAWRRRNRASVRSPQSGQRRVFLVFSRPNAGFPVVSISGVPRARGCDSSSGRSLPNRRCRWAPPGRRGGSCP